MQPMELQPRLLTPSFLPPRTIGSEAEPWRQPLQRFRLRCRPVPVPTADARLRASTSITATAPSGDSTEEDEFAPYSGSHEQIDPPPASSSSSSGSSTRGGRGGRSNNSRTAGDAQQVTQGKTKASIAFLNATAGLQSFARDVGTLRLRHAWSKAQTLKQWLESKWLQVGGAAGMIAALQQGRRRAMRRARRQLESSSLPRKLREHWHRVVAVFLGLLLLLGTPTALRHVTRSSSFQDHLPVVEMRKDEQERIKAMRLASRSVVTVSGQGSAPISCTGWLYDSRGYIVTSAQAVSRAFAPSLSVRFADQTELPAICVGVDRMSNIALLKVQPSAGRLPAPPLSLRSTVERAPLGQDVFVMGNAAGAGAEVSRGIVSGGAKAVSSPGQAPVLGSFQVDVPVHADNEGGPVLSSRGKVLGMAVSMTPTASRQQFPAKQGLVVSSSTIARSVENIISNGNCERPSLGLYLATGDGPSRSSKRSPSDGAVVVQVPRHAAAGKAGIQVGDVITSIAGKRVHNTDDVMVQLEQHSVSDLVSIRLSRPISKPLGDDGLGPTEYHEMTVVVRLEAAPD